MRILVAEDDNASRIMLQAVLSQWGYEVIAVADGNEAWTCMNSETTPLLVILDWIMPGKDGVDICRDIRKIEKKDRPFYIILLTGKDSKQDIVAGLNAGANDYITKPFDNEELCARIAVGKRVVELQTQLNLHVEELQHALDHIKTLQGILPICSYCKKIRDDQNYWQQVESYISKTTDARFTHSVCPDCYENHIKPQMEMFKKSKSKKVKSGD